MDPDPLSNPTIIWEGISLIILLILSAFFSSSETAMMSVSRKKLLDAMEIDSYDLEKNLKVSNRYLTVILIMNNVVNVLLSSLATVLAIQLFPKGTSGSKLVAIVTLVITVLVVVFGEITPKIYARVNAPKFFKRSFPIIKILDFIFRPITWAFTALSVSLIRIFVGKPNVEPFISHDEILFNIDMGKNQGVIEEQESVLVKGALTLKDTYVREIMVPRVEIVGIDVDKTLADAVKVFDESKFSRLPVYEENIDQIIGICYAKDILSVLNSPDEKLENIKVKSMMRSPYFVPETKKIDDLLQEMRRMKMHIAIVVDEYGGTAGLVTLEDVLEEMTGEIFDEFDIEEEETPIVKRDKYTYVISGLTPLNDIERELNIEFPESEFETIGGYLLKVFERVPKPGEIVDTEQFRVKILESNKKQILKIEIRLKKGPENDEK
ncbi:hemolysin family protein [Mesoaciditoga lauensis]|uniref:hemolysin family protein n=1 Tax=Mesoaciditoga lauensis TaxID=1495039 RepID=UPI000690E256|nr:hemolysin family protein [Mesoaciditoga lauensis]